jgi:hypothetical protein
MAAFVGMHKGRGALEILRIVKLHIDPNVLG